MASFLVSRWSIPLEVFWFYVMRNTILNRKLEHTEITVTNGGDLKCRILSCSTTWLSNLGKAMRISLALYTYIIVKLWRENTWIIYLWFTYFLNKWLISIIGTFKVFLLVILLLNFADACFTDETGPSTRIDILKLHPFFSETIRFILLYGILLLFLLLNLNTCNNVLVSILFSAWNKYKSVLLLWVCISLTVKVLENKGKRSPSYPF